MDDICTYQIEVQGQVDIDDLNAISPLQMTAIQAGTASTLFTIHTDQSGLIGFIRHMHGRGFIFLFIIRERPHIS